MDLEITLASPIRKHFCLGWITFCDIVALSNENSETVVFVFTLLVFVEIVLAVGVLCKVL